MADEQNPEKKIIIDEDWKAQVQAEKEAAQHQEAAERPAQEQPLPPPDLTFLASTLYLQGMVSLGLLPNPLQDKPAVQLNQAKHATDSLQVLFDKTAGNRTREETEAIDNMLHELRLAYVAVQAQVSKTGTPLPPGEVG
jgi:hypothetical protein